MLALLLAFVCMAPPDGSVIFWESGFLVRPIERATGSDLTHVAIVLYENDGPYVYEATYPRVRRLPYAEYIAHLEELKARPRWAKLGFKWTIMTPVESYTAQDLLDMKQYARSQLGRPYQLRGYWKGREVNGIFCSQYVGNCIEKSGRIQSANYKESPVSLKQKLERLYK
jgi:hypothetical protein